jgi:hypothetical protein
MAGEESVIILLERIATALEKIEADGLIVFAKPENVIDILEEVAEHRRDSSH